MPFIGNKPSAVPLTSADIADSIITSAKIVDATIANADIANSTIALAKLSATGTASASTFLRGDNSWASAGAAAGQVIQVVSTTKTDTFSTASTSYVDVTGLSVSITPSSASNKILIIASIYGGNDTQYSFARLMRGSTEICIADASGSNNRSSFTNFFTGDSGNFKNATQNFLDSPNTTSSVTYKVQMTTGGSGTIYLNYGGSGDSSSSRGKTASTITVMEIKG